MEKQKLYTRWPKCRGYNDILNETTENYQYWDSKISERHTKEYVSLMGEKFQSLIVCGKKLLLKSSLLAKRTCNANEC